MSKRRKQPAQLETPANPPVPRRWWKDPYMFVLLAVAVVAGSYGYGLDTGRARELPDASAPHDHQHEASTGASATAPAVSEGISEGTIKGTTNVAQLIEIGDHEFDADRPRLAILAYEKALSYQPNDSDVRTDLGVMYRRLGRFDDAIKQFEQARKLSPKHENSRYNLGVVYRHDLGQHAQAIAAWEDYLRVAPHGQRAAEARRSLAEAREHLRVVTGRRRP